MIRLTVSECSFSRRAASATVNRFVDDSGMVRVRDTAERENLEILPKARPPNLTKLPKRCGKGPTWRGGSFYCWRKTLGFFLSGDRVDATNQLTGMMAWQGLASNPKITKIIQALSHEKKRSFSDE
jgi:hypothetical protein